MLIWLAKVKQPNEVGGTQYIFYPLKKSGIQLKEGILSSIQETKKTLRIACHTFDIRCC